MPPWAPSALTWSAAAAPFAIDYRFVGPALEDFSRLPQSSLAHAAAALFFAFVVRAALRGYRDGRRASWLPGQDWESLLAQPVEEVRRRLRIPPPTPYQALLSELAAT